MRILTVDIAKAAFQDSKVVAQRRGQATADGRRCKPWLDDVQLQAAPVA